MQDEDDMKCFECDNNLTEEDQDYGYCPTCGALVGEEYFEENGE